MSNFSSNANLRSDTGENNLESKTKMLSQSGKLKRQETNCTPIPDSTQPLNKKNKIDKYLSDNQDGEANNTSESKAFSPMSETPKYNIRREAEFINSDIQRLSSNENINDDSKKRKATTCLPICTHYKRNCLIVAPCCDLIFGCRVCHDDHFARYPSHYSSMKQISKENRSTQKTNKDSINLNTEIKDEKALPPKEKSNLKSNHDIGQDLQLRSQLEQQMKQQQNKENSAHRRYIYHELDRKAIKEIICKKCNTQQTSKRNSCIKCKTKFGEYHCSICNLWMSKEEKPFHCKECDICRIGGEESFKHCFKCGICVSKVSYENHDCIENRSHSTCPICQENLFSSRSACHSMPCGHDIHWTCFQQLIKHDSRCPVCKKTCNSRENLMRSWESMAFAILMQPMPSKVAKIITIKCVDCQTQEENRFWHVIGVQCKSCLSFNTDIHKIHYTDEAASLLPGGEEQLSKKEREDAYTLFNETRQWINDHVT